MPTTDYDDRILAEPALVFYAPGDEAAGQDPPNPDLIADLKGSLTGTVSGATLGATGLLDATADGSTAASFDGSNDYIDWGDNLDFDHNSTFSLEAWGENTGGPAGERAVFSKLDVAGGYRGYELDVMSNGKVRLFLISTFGYPYFYVDSDNTVGTGRFHIVCTYSGSGAASGVKLYINGVESTVTSGGTTLDAGTTTNSTALRVGTRPDGSNQFGGKLQKLAIYNAVLSSTAVADHYAFGIGDHGPPLIDLTQPVPIILDTDMCEDVDDVADLGVLLALANEGKATPLAVVLCNSNDYSAPATQALLDYYGWPSVPIGAYQGNDLETTSAYCEPIRDRFRPGETRADYDDDVTVYRTALRDAADGSVVIVLTGFATTLKRLLQSAGDGIDARTGLQLVTDKVRRLVVVAGYFPTSNEEGPEYNLGRDPADWIYVLDNWPVGFETNEIVWCGIELGYQLQTGPPVDSDPLVSPVKYAFDLWSGGVTERYAWGQLGVLYAAEGSASGMDATGVRGTNTVDPVDGGNVWTQTPDHEEWYLGFTSPVVDVETRLQDLLLDVTSDATAATLPLVGGGLVNGGLIHGGLVGC